MNKLTRYELSIAHRPNTSPEIIAADAISRAVKLNLESNEPDEDYDGRVNVVRTRAQAKASPKSTLEENTPERNDNAVLPTPPKSTTSNDDN